MYSIVPVDDNAVQYTYKYVKKVGLMSGVLLTI